MIRGVIDRFITYIAAAANSTKFTKIAFEPSKLLYATSLTISKFNNFCHNAQNTPISSHVRE